MTYITLTDLETRFGADELIKLADRNGDGTADADAVSAAISDAEAIVESHLAGRYALPLSPVPGLIIRLICSIARRNLYDDKAPEQVEAEYKGAITALEKISSGELQIINAENTLSGPEYSGGTPMFNAAKHY